MTSYSSTAVLYGHIAGASAAREIRACSKWRNSNSNVSRAPTTDLRGTAHPRTSERERRERSAMERKSGCRTSSSRTRRAAAPIAGSVIGQTDLTLPNSLGLQGRFQVIAGSTAGTSFLKNPACELWDRETDNCFASYIIRARMLHAVCFNNFVRSTAVEPCLSHLRSKGSISKQISG